MIKHNGPAKETLDMILKIKAVGTLLCFRFLCGEQ